MQYTGEGARTPNATTQDELQRSPGTPSKCQWPGNLALQVLLDTAAWTLALSSVLLLLCVNLYLCAMRPRHRCTNSIRMRHASRSRMLALASLKQPDGAHSLKCIQVLLHNGLACAAIVSSLWSGFRQNCITRWRYDTEA